jgi:putative salt-induced outer membrane protein YdiY
MSLLLSLSAPLALLAGPAPAGPFAAAPVAPDWAPDYGAPLPLTSPAAGRLARFFAQDEAAEEATEKEAVWTGSVTLGATFTAGNSDITSAAADAEAVYATADYRWSITGYWTAIDQTINEDDGAGTVTQTKTKQHREGVRSQFDYFFTEELYAYGMARFDSDSEANLNGRSNFGVGLGYQFYQEEDRSLAGELGVNYIKEDFVGQDDDAEFVSARAAYNYFYRVNENVDFNQLGEIYPSLEDSDDFTARLTTALQVALSASMFLKIQHILDYDNTPATFSDGESFEEIDHRVVLTVGWSF